MPDYYDVALVGFSHSEYATFETFFRLVSSRRPKPFRATMQLASASMVMLSTNDTTDIERTLAAITAEQPLITVGVRRVANAWRHLERPINLNAVLMTVDAAIGAIAPNGASAAPVADLRPTPTIAIVPPQPMPAHSGANGHSAPVRTTSPPTTDRIAATLPEVAQTTTPRVAPMPPTAPLPARDAPMPRPTAPSRDLTPSSRVPATASASPQAGGVASPNLAARPPSPGVATAPASSVSRVSILVVDDSDVALKFIHGRLSAFGFHVDKCTSGEEALVRVSDGQYQFVFLDVMMEGLDGYQTCKAIKGRRYPSGHAPVVVMLTSRGGTIDKVRGTFAGCDAYLTKPLDETKMLKVLLKHDPNIGDQLSTMTNPKTTTIEQPLRGQRNGGDPLAAAYSNLGDRSR